MRSSAAKCAAVSDRFGGTDSMPRAPRPVYADSKTCRAQDASPQRPRAVTSTLATRRHTRQSSHAFDLTGPRDRPRTLFESLHS